MKKRILTGITTTGTPHIGNYLGAINSLYKYRKIYNYENIDLCHRIDKHTSGCIVVSLNKKANISFNKCLLENEVQKVYKAIVKGSLRNDIEIEKELFTRNNKSKSSLSYFKPIKELKKSAMDSIKNNEAVWFGCDVGKRFSRDMGVLDMGIYDYENVFQTSFKMNKQTRLEYGDSEMTHAMLLTGVDIKKRNSTKWKIENSWGTKSGNQGYMMMTDEWFDEYTYEVVIDKKYLNKRLLKYLDMEPVALAPWDPMGALAR